MKGNLIVAGFLFYATIVQAQKKANPASIHPLPADSNIVLPPSWAFGVLYGGYTNQQQTIDRVRQIREHQYPIDAYWIDSWFWSFGDKGVGPHKYIDFVGDNIAYPNRIHMWDSLEQMGVRGGFWVWDCIQRTGNEAAYDDFAGKGHFSGTYINKNLWHNKSTSTAMHAENSGHAGTLTGNINFKDSAAAGYFKQRMKHFFDEGADFIKLDRTSDIATCRTMFEMSQEFGGQTKGRGFILSHTGGMETEEYKRYPTKWTDDTRSDWSVVNPLIEFNDWVPNVALKENIAMFTNPESRTSEIPFLTNDLGGFDMGKTDRPEEELYIRWMQFSMFNPITEVFSQPENPTANLAWNYSNRADSLFRQYAHWRMRLFPYIYSTAHQARLNGQPFIGKIKGQLHEYFFGKQFLVAPVFQKGATSRQLMVPKGRWINFWTGEVVQGNRQLELASPLEQIPLLVKAGAIVPMRNYAASVEVGNNHELHVQIYPGAGGRFQLVEDDGISNGYLQGQFAVTELQYVESDNRATFTIQPAQGHFRGMPDRRVWQLVVHSKKMPAKLTINGKNSVSQVQKEDSVWHINLGTHMLDAKLEIEWK